MVVGSFFGAVNFTRSPVLPDTVIPSTTQNARISRVYFFPAVYLNVRDVPLTAVKGSQPLVFSLYRLMA